MYRSRSQIAAAVLATLAVYTTPTLAQAAQSPQVDGLKILELLVAKGLVQRDEADAIIAEAGSAPPAAATVAPAAPDAEGQLVAHVPEPVRRQIKEELRAEVMQQAKTEGWASPGETAEWTQRIKITGDIRTRAEAVQFDKPRYDPQNPAVQISGNYSAFPDFNKINTGRGFDLNGIGNAPFLNTTENRERARIRARLGVEAKVGDWVTAELRLASGSDTSPVSTNQTLGSGSELGKYQFWLDRAAIRLAPLKSLQITVGRAANPFWTSELLFDEDLNFDGLSLHSDVQVARPVVLFGTLGAFPIYNTAFDFGSTDTVKTKSHDKYLLGSQVGVSIKPTERSGVRFAAGYFDFRNLRSELSAPCLATLDTCPTDITRPQFMQFGNTLTSIRNIDPDPDNPNGPQLQYYGLASDYRVIDAHAQFDYVFVSGTGVRLTGDYVRNLDYDHDAVLARGPITNRGNEDVYKGGDDGWYAGITAGNFDITTRGNWSLSVGYKYLQSDAVVDAFTDSDFHLGGTNAKGFIVGGKYGLATGTSLGVRWLSASEISGMPYAVDLLQLDLLTRF